MHLKDDEHTLHLIGQAIEPLIGRIEQATREWDASLRGTRLRGALPVPVLTSSGAQNVAFAPGQWAGFTLTETTGTSPATVSFYNGRDKLADLIMTVTLAGNESAREVWHRGITYTDGLFLTVTGTVAGSVLLIPGA